MKLVRFLDDSGQVQFGSQHADGSTTLIEGDIFGEFSDTGTAATVSKLLAPTTPADILCIARNPRRPAAAGPPGTAAKAPWPRPANR